MTATANGDGDSAQPSAPADAQPADTQPTSAQSAGTPNAEPPAPNLVSKSAAPDRNATSSVAATTPHPRREPTAAGTEQPGDDGSFGSFQLDPAIVEAVGRLGFTTPTPIQGAAMPPMLAGRDIIARARTGSGKTAAFGLPLLHRLTQPAQTKPGRTPPVRALVLAPTRELALQVTEALRSFAKLLPIPVVAVYGGASYDPQLRALRKGAPVVVGTPGRVLDHLRRGTLDLSRLEALVLDEADEMLRMGFIEDVETVLEATPEGRQVALFSATMPEPIRRIAEAHLRDPETVEVEDRALSVGHIDQRWVAVPNRHKIDALERVLAAEDALATLVFARTRAGCAEAADILAKRGLEVDALHGDLNQSARERVLNRFRSKQLRVVVATDVAARGIDVEHLSHVINFDLPNDVENYVHRIGRTARAGRKGAAISFVTPKERARIKWLERKLKVRIAPMRVPSDADIAAAKRGRLLNAIRETAAEPPSPGVLAALEELRESNLSDTELNNAAIAGAVLRLLGASRSLDFDREVDPRPPHWSTPGGGRNSDRDRGDGPRRGSDAAHAKADAKELFFAAGRAHGVRPGDLMGALANEAGIAGKDIGRITVLAHKSFVRMTEEAARQVLDAHAEFVIRKRRVRVSSARPMSEGASFRPGEKPSHGKPGSSRAGHGKAGHGKAGRFKTRGGKPSPPGEGGQRPEGDKRESSERDGTKSPRRKPYGPSHKKGRPPKGKRSKGPKGPRGPKGARNRFKPKRGKR